MDTTTTIPQAAAPAGPPRIPAQPSAGGSVNPFRLGVPVGLARSAA
ncbi:hypothetical protein ACFV1W_32345 [Kitasatospora sp. NPDC059648]